jgi:hypothetical protein
MRLTRQRTLLGTLEDLRDGPEVVQTIEVEFSVIPVPDGREGVEAVRGADLGPDPVLLLFVFCVGHETNFEHPRSRSPSSCRWFGL